MIQYALSLRMLSTRRLELRVKPGSIPLFPVRFWPLVDLDGNGTQPTEHQGIGSSILPCATRFRALSGLQSGPRLSARAMRERLAQAELPQTEKDALTDLRARAGDYRPHLAQGASFAAKARQRAGNETPHTDLAFADSDLLEMPQLCF